MYTIDLNFSIKQLDGSVLENCEANKVIAGVLCQATENPIKFYGWGVELYLKGVIKIDEADYKTLYSFVENSKVLPNLTKAQVMQAMEKSKEASKE